MAERNLDFDRIIDRRNTGSLKYDFAVKRRMPEGILPLWVADMDFAISSYIQEALIAQAQHGIYGYNESRESYFEAVRDWMASHHGWRVEEKWLIKTPGVVFALAMAVKAYTQPGDGVLIQRPVYYPFYEVIRENDRNVVDNTLVQGEDGRYHMDLADLERKLAQERVKLFILCNPHNPVGRVWSDKELRAVGELCRKHEVIVVSDEIHQDFVFQGRHQVFAALGKEYEDISVICTAPSKTFNLAGLQISNIFIPNAELRKKFRHQVDAAGYSQVNGAGLVACEAAYRQGEEWYQAVKKYIWDNICYMERFLRERIPLLRMQKPEGTYLVWIDCRGLQLSPEELEKLIIHRAGLWLDGGGMFGPSGEGFQRINAACPRATLTKALEKLEAAVRETMEEKDTGKIAP